MIVTAINNIKAYQRADKGELFNKNSNIIYLISSLISNLNSMIFFLSDHILWLCNVWNLILTKIGVINNPNLKSRSDWWSDFTWIWESLFDTICAAIELHLLNQKLIFLVTINYHSVRVVVNLRTMTNRRKK